MSLMPAPSSTTTAHVADIPEPSDAVAFITALPLVCNEMSPSESTDATVELSLDHTKVFSEAFSGVIVAVS